MAKQTKPTPARHLGIRELREQSAKYVQRAGAGENIVISVSGEPVALLGPLHLTSNQVSITELIAKTALIAPRRKDAFVLSEPVSVHSGARIDQQLREVRG
jgi:prevent-host-death family protein